MILFRILLGIDVLAALVIVYFFFVGLADGSVSSFNGGLWFAILAGVAAIIGGGWSLNAKSQRGAANVLLAVLAVPAVLFGAFMLLILIANPRWN
jgi:hypothetical protein